VPSTIKVANELSIHIDLAWISVAQRYLTYSITCSREEMPALRAQEMFSAAPFFGALMILVAEVGAMSARTDLSRLRAYNSITSE